MKDSLSAKTDHRRYLMHIILLALLYFVTGKLSIAVINNSYIITMGIFVPEGFAMAAVLIYGYRIWPGIFLGQFVLSLSEHVPLLPSLGIALSNSLEAIIVWHLFHAMRLNRSLSTLRDVMGLFAIILFAAQPFSAFFGTLFLQLASLLESNYWLSLFSWWFGNSMAQVLWTPMLLLLYAHRKEIRYTSLLGIVGLFGALIYALLFFTQIYSLPLLIAITMPIVIYITIFRDLLTGTILVVTMSVITMAAAYTHTGIFSVYNVSDNIINLNFYLLSHVLVVLVVGTLYHENSRTRERLQQLNLTLEEQVTAQVDTLREQQAIIAEQSKLASLGELLGMIAHQWRQPLNRINANIAVIDTLTGENPTIHEKIENVKKQTRYLSETIEDFSHFFHPDKKKLTFEPSKTVHKALMLIEPKEVGISFDIPDTPVYITSYENEYLQVLLSILHNMLENFKVHRTANPCIHIALTETTQEVILSLEDNGGGIKTEKIENIFDPFVTANVTGKNSGLGLYMARVLVHTSMKGTLKAQNQHNGVLFTITLPKGKQNNA